MQPTTRRSFFKQAGLGLAAAGVAPDLLAADNAAMPCGQTKKPAPFFVAVAGYSLYKFKLEPALEILKRVGVHHLCIKDFHLPLTSTDAEIAAFHETCKRYDVAGYGVGPIYMASEEEVNKAFAYARRVGVKTLVGVPFKLDGKKRVASPELLKLIDENVKTYDIRYAIHNHGPDMPELFPNAESGIELIKSLDARVGLCLDIGHQYRDGKCPVKALADFADRIHDIHIKNVTAPTIAGRGIEMPRGEIDIPAFVRGLRSVGYTGACSLEYEKDMADPLAGIAESIGYFRGVIDATR